MTSTPNLAVVWERFFTQRLRPQRQASPHTISASRDTFRLLLLFTQPRLRKPPARVALTAMDAPRIMAFLAELEQRRGIAPRSRHLRLTAIRAFVQYAACEAPAQSAQIQRVLAIPGTRYTRALLHCLTRPAGDAWLAAPDQRTWSGRRDHAFLLTAMHTGVRVSARTGLHQPDVTLGTGAHLRVVGKGRKARC